MRHFPLTSGALAPREPPPAARELSPVPSLHRRHTRRPRLTRLLDASAAQAILIIGPPGYGKTSLACEWLAGRPDVAWYRATSASADLAAFSVGIADVVAPLVPGAGDRLRQRLRIAEAPEKAVRPLAELLAEDLAGWPAGAWLVIDDYHLVVDSTPVEEFMDWLLTLAPLRVLVTTRRRPAWASARRILYGEVSELSKEQLAMTNEEAARVLEGRPGEAVRALVTQAQGWPALIGLAALSATSEIPTERISEGLFRYFAEEVFRQEPPEIQRFMLVASVPHTVNARIAREVLGVEQPERLLEQLSEEGLLQQSGSGELAFHPLLRDFLRRKLDAEQPDEGARLAARAIDHARRAARWEEAFDLATHRGELDEAATIVEQASPLLLAAGRIETIEKWLSVCGPHTLRIPGAALARAEVLLRQGRYGEAEALALSIADDLTPANAVLSRALSLAAEAAHLLSHDQRALELHLQARKAAQTDTDRQRALWGAVVASAELELPDAEEYLAEFRSQSHRDVDAKLRTAVGIMLHSERKGSLAGVSQVVGPLLPLVDYAIDPMIRSSFLVQLSYVQVLRGHYAEALRLARHAAEICKTMRVAFGEAACSIAAAHAEIGLRQFKQARETIAGLRKASRQVDDGYLDAAGHALGVKLALAEGLPASSSISPSEQLISRNLKGEIHALRAVSLAVRGEHDLALRHASTARDLTSGIEAHYISRYAELIVACSLSNSKDFAVQSAVALFRDTAQDEMFDACVIAYRAQPSLLQSLEQSSEHLPLLYDVLARANDRDLAARYGLDCVDFPRTRIHSLTTREREVLDLICQGLSNADIARQLFIAPSTAKVHVHRILKKLGAKSRLQAVLVARELPDELNHTSGGTRRDIS